jgi:AraC-like DNA-binding protein
VGRSATDACFAAGFQDFSRFISKFRREFGMTPAKYRSIYHSGTKRAIMMLKSKKIRKFQPND